MRFKKKPEKTCPKGHPQEESWEQCPFCRAEEAEKLAQVAETAAEVEEDEIDSGKGAVIVPKKAPASPRKLAGWLVVLAGEQAGEDFRIHSGRNTIGKGAKVDIVLRDAHVAERHAVVEARASDGSYHLFDLGSKLGSLVNGERVENSREIADGDVLRLGHTELGFRAFVWDE